MRAYLAPALLLASAAAAQANPNALLHAMQACLADPARHGCTEVDAARGFVVMKDDNPAKPQAWLVVPATEVTGIESPAVLKAPVLDFWTYAWDAGATLLPAEPASDRALAINSEAGRSQNLLHIHVSCVLASIRDALAKTAVGPDWSGAPVIGPYDARKVPTLDPSPFELLAERPGARADMAAQSLAVVGAPDGGFYLLAHASVPGAPAEAEDLLDETCD